MLVDPFRILRIELRKYRVVAYSHLHIHQCIRTGNVIIVGKGDLHETSMTAYGQPVVLDVRYINAHHDNMIQ